MPVQPRPTDSFTRGNLLIGFSVIEFTPTNGSLVEMGILESQSLGKEVSVLQLERGDSGLITVDREIVNRFEPFLEMSTFNLRSDIAQLTFGSSTIVANSANAAQAVVDEAITIPTDFPTSMISLLNGRLDETPANINVTCAPIVNELVGVGDGALGTTDGDFTLAFKVNALGDVTRLQEITTATGAVVRTFTVQAGEPAGANEAQLAIGANATSGQLDLNQAVAVGNELRADYTPSFTFEDDLTAANTDVVVDPLLGRIRFPNAGAATGKVKAGQSMLVDYQYNRLASVTLQPFTRLQVDGSARVRHLTDIGSNFVWDIPSVTLRVTDDALEFGAQGFVVSPFRLTVNDASPGRFGTMTWSSEAEANAS